MGENGKRPSFTTSGHEAAGGQAVSSAAARRSEATRATRVTAIQRFGNGADDPQDWVLSLKTAHRKKKASMDASGIIPEKGIWWGVRGAVREKTESSSRISVESGGRSPRGENSERHDNRKQTRATPQ